MERGMIIIGWTTEFITDGQVVDVMKDYRIACSFWDFYFYFYFPKSFRESSSTSTKTKLSWIALNSSSFFLDDP